jgi:hypothetical protein
LPFKLQASLSSSSSFCAVGKYTYAVGLSAFSGPGGSTTVGEKKNAWLPVVVRRFQNSSKIQRYLFLSFSSPCSDLRIRAVVVVVVVVGMVWYYGISVSFVVIVV